MDIFIHVFIYLLQKNVGLCTERQFLPGREDAVMREKEYTTGNIKIGYSSYRMNHEMRLAMLRSVAPIIRE